MLSYISQVSGAFANLRKATSSIALSVCPFSCARLEDLGFHWTDYEICCLRICRQYVEKIQVWLKYDKNNKYFRWRRISCRIILRKRNVSNKNCGEYQNTYFIFGFFLGKACRLWGNVKKYGTPTQATVDNTVWRRKCTICMPDN